MISGSTTYMEIKTKTPISLISEMIFSFFAGKGSNVILQKRYPGDTEEIGGKLYLKFTQEDTVRLYQLSGNGEIELETQVNLANKAVVQQPKRGIKVRRTRAVELVPGNAPHYEMPDTMIDIVTGDVVLLKGDPGKDGVDGKDGAPGKDGKDGYSVTVASVTESDESGGENIVEFSDGKAVHVKNGKDGKDGAPGKDGVDGKDGAPGKDGKDYTLTESDKDEIAEKSATRFAVGRYATVSADAWSDDTDKLNTPRAQRIAYKTGSGIGKANIVDHWGVGENVELSENWQVFEREFTYSPAGYTGELYLIFYGGKNEVFCHPYDIADVKLWLASDAERKNLLPEDIAKLNWWWNDPRESCLEVNRFSVAYEDDGSKYIHVWRQNDYAKGSGSVARNLVELRAATGAKLTEGETYVLSMRMRTTCAQHTAIAECEGIRDHSATVVSPVPTSVSAYLNNGVRAFGQRIGELMLKADTKPNSDITVGIQATRGQGTGVIINTVMPEIMGALDTALLCTIGSGVVE